MSLRKYLSWTALLGTSLGLHAVGFAKLNHLGGPGEAKAAKKPAFVEMTTVAKPSAPEPPRAPEKPAPRTVRRVAAVSSGTPPSPRAAERAPVTPPVAETPADFSGTTLTNDGAGAGPGWASATGNGAAMHGPVGRPGARVTGRHVEGIAPPPRPTSTPVVAVADLSRLPEAPRLEDALERNYPAEARQGGLTGKAVVRARISPEGSVRDLVVVSESAAGFGRACRDTLAGSRWTPPLDREGRAVATVINYTCRFEVR